MASCTSGSTRADVLDCGAIVGTDPAPDGASLGFVPLAPPSKNPFLNPVAVAALAADEGLAGAGAAVTGFGRNPGFAAMAASIISSRKVTSPSLEVAAAGLADVALVLLADTVTEGTQLAFSGALAATSTSSSSGGPSDILVRAYAVQ